MGIFDFQAIQWFWLFVSLPFLFVFLFFLWKQFLKFGKYWEANPCAFEGYLPPWSLRIAKVVFCLIGLSLVILALTNPFYQSSVAQKKYQGVRFIFLVDVSLSMEMAEDIPPSRLIAAKEEIKSAISGLDGSYEMAILPFAGEANPYYYLPSFDDLSFLLALENLDSTSIPISGTHIVGALEALTQLINELDLKDCVNVIMLLSDGGLEEGFAVNRIELARLTSQLGGGNSIYVVGIGKTAPTPLIRRDFAGNFKGYVNQPPTGSKRAYSQLDENLLKFIAKSGGGRYFRFDERQKLQNEIKKIIESNRKLARVDTVLKKKPLRSWLLLAGIICFLIMLIELPRKKETP